jgi:hypothetical protein
MKAERLTNTGVRDRDIYVVKDGEAAVGMLVKYRDTRTETYPWQAYLGTGDNPTFLGAYYDSDSFIATTQDVMVGGRKAAIQAIADARHATSGKVPAGIDFDVP